MEDVDAQVAVTDSGNAAAAAGATAVTGYRGPAPADAVPGARVRVSGTGDAHATEGGLANSGYIHQVSAERLTMVQQRAPREPASWPHQVGVIPSRAQSFQHRAEAERLRVAVEGGGTAVLGQVLTGMGGVGKTQLAADYACTAWDNGGLDVLVWVTASIRSSVVTGYAQAGVELCQADPNNPEQAAQTFLAWLTPKTGAKPCRWLIALDDVADPDDLHGLWPPASPYGRTLVTTRRRDAALTGEGRRRIEIGLFTEAEAVAYLVASLAAHGRREPAAQLTTLVSDLGYLPLALAQAAAYIVDAGIPIDCPGCTREQCPSYRSRLADRAATLADTAPDRLPDEQALPLAAAWSLSIDRADILRPAGLARPMLQLAAMLDANGIPSSVLTSPPALTHLAAHRTFTGQDPTEEPDPVSPLDAVRALRALHRLSLIDHTPTTPDHAVRVHQLIQRATRDTLIPTQHDQIARTSADALIAAWPDIERDTDLAQILRANVDALQSHAEAALWHTPEILLRSARSLLEAGQHSAAIASWNRLHSGVLEHRGPDDLYTLLSRGHLIGAQGESDPQGAVDAYEKLLADGERVFGPDHRFTLTTRSRLAGYQGEAGDEAGAAALYEELLNHVERVFGPDDPLTVATSLQLFRWLTKDPISDRDAGRRVLERALQVLGPDHPDILAHRSNIAWKQGEAGDAIGAAATLEEVLSDQERALGSHHPKTFHTRFSIAHWRRSAGDVTGAAGIHERLLADQERFLGLGHPKTLASRLDLARWRCLAGDVTGALGMYERLLADQERFLGPDHPDTLGTRGILARWQSWTTDAAEATATYKQLLELMGQVLGPEHPYTLATSDNFATWQSRCGGEAGTIGMYEQLLAEQESVLGLDHPLTLATRSNLTFRRGEAGQDGPAAG
ncbi:FxSxx-COOH system tetratricopeptide repeat protein [Streptomyces mirabilis]|uniref:FxSxx-COOH system tetratricopeptide repeat protein n=1 Tax=Streptomyces mirabilis TaxID=68239 RepID=UPI00364F3E3A